MPEILAEYFAIKFDDSPDLRKEFEGSIIEIKKADLDWLEAMEEKYKKDKQLEGGIIKETDSIEEKSPKEFEDTY